MTAAPDGALPWTVLPGGLRLALRVTPRAARTAVAGCVQLPDGRSALSLRVAAPPVDGAANAEVVACLAKLLGLGRSAIRIASGETGRLKLIELAGEPEALARALRAALA